MADDRPTDDPPADVGPEPDAAPTAGRDHEAKRAIEAILMVSDRPVEPHLLAQVLELAPAEVSRLVAELTTEYDESDRGFEVGQVAGGYRFQSHPDLFAYVERFVMEGQQARLSSAALETLAIVAYKQPLSRAQVAAIRGVNVDGVIRTLEQRGYIAEVGRDPGPGQATLFGTTDLFLEKMGINDIEDLPPVAAFVPGADVVEALEHGLRAEADQEPDAVADEEPDEGPEQGRGDRGPGSPDDGGEAIPDGS